MSTPAAKVIDDLVRQFPDAPALTLAKRAYGDHPSLWSNLEACRSAVRKRFGVIGKRTRQKTKDKSAFREPRPAGWQSTIPPSLRHYERWGPVQIDGPCKALILSDIHVPYHDEAAFRIAVNYGLDREADTVILNGDIMDCFSLSRWEKDPRKRDFPAEVRAGRQLLGTIRDAFPDARIVYKEGNHEERFSSYLRLKAPELLGLPEFTWESVFELDDLNIEWVSDKRPLRIGKLNVIHGHEYRFAISNPVNPARGYYLRGQCHCLGGHFHQHSEHSQKNLEQKVVSTWSTGCLCDMHPDYAPLNNWSQGFAFVSVSSAGAFSVSNLRIVDGEAY